MSDGAKLTIVPKTPDMPDPSRLEIRHRIHCELADFRQRRGEDAPDCTWAADCGGASCTKCGAYLDRHQERAAPVFAVLDGDRDGDPCYWHDGDCYGPFDDLSHLLDDLRERGLTAEDVEVGKFTSQGRQTALR